MYTMILLCLLLPTLALATPPDGLLPGPKPRGWHGALVTPDACPRTGCPAAQPRGALGDGQRPRGVGTGATRSHCRR